MNRRSLGTFFWGAILIVIGGLLLARNFGYSIPFWNMLAVYWPVLIIVWGMVKLIDYYRFRNMQPPPRLFSGGEVALLLFVIFAGSAVTVGANLSPTVGQFFGVGELIDLWTITGNNYEFTEHVEADVAPNSMIDIFNLYGNVEVRPAVGDRIILEVKKTVRAANQEEADRMAREFTFSITPQPDGSVQIRSNRDQGADPDQEQRGNDRQRFKSSMTLQVPSQSALHVTNRFGGTDVAQINGNHDLKNSFGAVNVRMVTGNVKIENRFGSVDVIDAKGDATLSTTFASATARNIEGAVTIKGSQNEIDVSNISGPLNIETSFHDVTVRDARSAIEIKGRYGDIDVALSQPPQGDVHLDSEFGDVSLKLPGEAAFTFDVHTRFGDIDSDFQSAENADGREKRRAGTVGRWRTARDDRHAKRRHPFAKERLNMFCPQCGTTAEDHFRYCSKCGAELSGVAKEIRPAPKEIRPGPERNMETHITVLGWLLMVSGVLTGILGAGIVIVGRLIPTFQLDRIPEVREIPLDVPRIATFAAIGIGLFTIAIAVGTFMAGYGLLQYKPWARIAAIVVAILGILHFPLGTALGIYALWALLSEPGRQYYLSKVAAA